MWYIYIRFSYFVGVEEKKVSNEENNNFFATQTLKKLGCGRPAATKISTHENL